MSRHSITVENAAELGRLVKAFTGERLGLAYVNNYEDGQGDRIVTLFDGIAFPGRGEAGNAAAYFAGMALEWSDLSGTPLPAATAGAVTLARGEYTSVPAARLWEGKGRQLARDAWETPVPGETPTPRRVESSAVPPLTGAAFATHHVAVWLVNDGDYYSAARNFAEDGTEGLRAYVSDLLYAPHRIYGTKPMTRDQRHVLTGVRGSFTRADFDGIDWEHVRAQLTAE